MEENEVTQDETQEQEQEQQLPKDASPDDLTLEELTQVDDDDFEKYTSNQMSAKDIREKYNFEEHKEDDEKEEESDEPDVEQSDEQETKPVSDENNQYKEYWDKVSAPFKANGTMYQPQSPDDVVSLMQKGVNYTQKMQQIAPYRRAFETLNKNNIDANELNFLIELHNGDKAAIKALLNRNKIDPMDFNNDIDDNASTYHPFDHSATDMDIAVSDLMQDLSTNKDKINAILNKWDAPSRNFFLQNPEQLRNLNAEIELGRFDEIQSQIDRIKMFGNPTGRCDLDLYHELAVQYENRQQNLTDMRQYSQQQQQQQVQQQSEASSKRAAAPSGRTNVKAKGTTLSPNDILSMSEDDFNKIDLNKLLAKG